MMWWRFWYDTLRMGRCSPLYIHKFVYIIAPSEIQVSPDITYEGMYGKAGNDNTKVYPVGNSPL